MKKILLLVFLVTGTVASGQNEYAITIESKKPSGIIDEMLYGQLFEHIYFSANNGVWQELIQERSFEPEQYPGIHPRDGYFDGWFMDDDLVLHSPTRYEQPLKIDSINTCDFDLTMDVNWRAYGSPYFVRIHDPYYESRTFTPAQTQAQIDAANEAAARARLQQQSATANFSICQTEVRETQGFGGRRGRRMNTLVPLASTPATKEQINERQQWHKLRIESRGSKVTVYWDGKQVVNIKLTATDGKVFFEGTPGDVKIPAVAQQWTAFGEGKYRLIKDDAINMRYSQEITAGKTEAGIFQGPQNIICREKYVGSIYAKGKGELIVGLRNEKGEFVARQSLGIVTKDWQKYNFTLEPRTLGTQEGIKMRMKTVGGRVEQMCGDGDFAIMVKNGTVQVDMVTMTTQTGKDLGGF